MSRLYLFANYIIVYQYAYAVITSLMTKHKCLLHANHLNNIDLYLCKILCNVHPCIHSFKLF